jgi:O-antigen/teichoic acid export membrane protein
VAAVLVPDDVGRALLGDTWAGAEPLVGLVGTQWTAIAVATAFAIALKALARTRELLAVSVVQALLVVALGTAGALLADAVGALTGLVAGQVAGVLLLLWMLRPRDTTP